MIPIFWYTTLHNLEQRHLPSPRRTTAVLTGYHSVVLTLWYLLIAGAVLHAFWFYWTTLIG
ncbi:hypothetical protein SAMN04488074_14610 [Lentzea albidocapillata subsp. violacea]|uniref:Uncharacterized protein n=1 Tax=Lentzea albidocapillata subsp. violacea TaxID=128104 RepID=A0A1H0AE57_9PSEU|nr:hypothetical protein SAMN04488074_14610 [Lentzea albidocapillata subsp. violacea]